MTNTAFTHRKLGQLATFINGSAFRPSDWGNLGLPIIRIQNLNGSSDFNYYTGRRVKCVPVEPGDLLFSWSGSIGTSFGAHRWSGQAGVLNQHIFKVVPADGVNPGLLYHVLRFATSRLEQMAHGGAGLVHIKKSVLVDFEVKLPTNARHLTRVATLLDLAESAVSATDALIAAKREQKRGLMQQLLTGKVRFPGFTEPWKTVRLGDVADVRFSNVDKHTIPGERQVRLCNYTDVFRNRFLHPDMDFMSASATAREIEKFGLKVGDVAITKDSETPDEIGVPALIDRTAPDLVLGYHLALLRADRARLDPGFLLILMESDLVRAHFQRRAKGLTRFALSIGAVADTPISLPKLGEQTKIAKIYRDITMEESLLEAQRASFVTQRHGLMERLLSGDILIPSSNTSAA